MKNILKLFAILSCIFLALAPTPKSGKSSGSKAALEWTEQELQGLTVQGKFIGSQPAAVIGKVYKDLSSLKLQPHQILGGILGMRNR